MVEIFKTDIRDSKQSESIINQLMELFPMWKINFDLEDADNILRVEAEHISLQTIIELLNKNGFKAEIII